MIELYHWEPVGHSLRVLISLQEIGVEYTSHYVDLLRFEQYSSRLLELNRAGQVPVLKYEGIAISESALINEYLAEKFPDARLAPADPLAWYTTQTWSKYIDYNLSSSLATLGCNKYLAPFLKNRGKQELEKSIADIPLPERQPAWRSAVSGTFPHELIKNSERKVELVTRRMEDILGRSEWLAGDDYSIADIDTFALIHGLRDVLPGIINSSNTPGTEAWHARIVERAAVRKALALKTSRYPDPIFAPGPEHSRWG
jgi:glutathione S-transferase